MEIKGFFVSEWDEGTIETPGTLDLATGELSVQFSESGSEYENLNEEKFISMSGEEYKVCSNCHQFITKVEMHDDNVGAGIHEVDVCRGNCEGA